MWLITWYSLGILAKFFVILLVLFGIFTLHFAWSVLRRLRSLRTVHEDESLRRSVAILSRRSSNLQQMTVTLFYLFGLTFFVQIPSAFWTPDSEHRSVAIQLADNFEIYFRLAAVVFLVFLILNSVPWFVSSQIRATALRAGMGLAD
jgi:hypothetical protein